MLPHVLLGRSECRPLRRCHRRSSQALLCRLCAAMPLPLSHPAVLLGDQVAICPLQRLPTGGIHCQHVQPPCRLRTNTGSPLVCALYRSVSFERYDAGAAPSNVRPQAASLRFSPSLSANEHTHNDAMSTTLASAAAAALSSALVLTTDALTDAPATSNATRDQPRTIKNALGQLIRARM